MESSQFINGEWVSRPIDIYQIMAGNRGQEEHDMRELDPKPQPDVPRLGILSRTIFSTPYVKFILPASIRQKNLNDVVFVGEDSIHLKEARANGSLRHIASKRDFDGRILAARIYRGPRKHEVKAEHGTPIQRKEVHAQRRSTASETADILPPEVIVLTLSSKTLVFAWAYQSPVGTVGFRCKTVRLPAGISPIDRTGTFLAIDPKCRAVAVAASEGHFILYKTKNMDAWREDIRAGHDSTPIEDERIIPIQGRIMHMEFLSSGATQDDSHVVLLFILAYGGKTKFTCYDWDSKHDLNTATARAERVGIVTGMCSAYLCPRGEVEITYEFRGSQSLVADSPQMQHRFPHDFRSSRIVEYQCSIWDIASL